MFETIIEKKYINSTRGIYSAVKIPKVYKEWDRKGYVYFIQIGDKKNRKYKIGTTCNILQRMIQHLNNYKESIYILWVSPAVSVYTTLRIEDNFILSHMQNEDFSYIPNDRFIISEKITEVAIKIKKEYVISI